MRTFLWVLCWALLGQACARVRHLEIKGDIELTDVTAKEDSEPTLEELLRIENPSDSSETSENVSEQVDDHRTLEELLLGHDEDENNEKSSKSKNPVKTKNYDFHPGSNHTSRSGRLFPVQDVTQTALAYKYVALVQATLPIGTTVRSGGGVYLTTRWVLTAAQVIVGAVSVSVMVGTLDATAPAAGVLATPYIHPNFVYNGLINDIALLKLVTAATGVEVIKLSTADTSKLTGSLFRTLGWGPPDDTLSLSATLNYIELPNLKVSTCKTLIKPAYLVYPSNTGCLGTSSGTKGFCNYDAGGPVVYVNGADDSETVVGLDSFHFACPSEYPSSFTLVKPFLNWIRTTTSLSLSSFTA